MAVPTVYTWTAFELVTASKMNQYISAAIDFLLNKPHARLSRAVTQSISNNTTTGIGMDTEAQDSDNGHSTTTNNSRYTAQTAGTWHFVGTAPWAANGSGKREARFRVNGTTNVHAQVFDINTSTAHANNLSAYIPLTVGDYVELVVFQSSGGSLNVDTTLGGPRMDCMWERV